MVGSATPLITTASISRTSWSSSSSIDSSKNNTGVSTIALKFAGSSSADQFAALPLLHGINRYIEDQKAQLYDGTNQQWSNAQKKIYFKFRLVSYSLIPSALNLISLLVCTLLCVITIPCNRERKEWSWNHLKGSLGYLVQSIYDLTCDIRLGFGKCCCSNSNSSLLRV